MADYKFKSKVKLQGGGNLPNETASTVVVLDASKDFISSTVTLSELAAFGGDITAAQGDATQALSDAAAAQADATQALSDAAAAQSDINDHIADTVGAHAASAISSIPSGNLAAIEVQAALNELQSDIDTRALNSDLTDHINDTVGAHAASAISNIPSGNLAATEVQAALNELQGDADSLDGRLDAIEPDVADLITLSGVAANSTDLGTFTGTTIPDSSTVKAAFQSLESFIESMPDPMEYKGLYNATTDSPALADGIGDNGDVYHVSVAGTQDFGSGAITFAVGDKVVYNGATGLWEKWDMTDAVASVNGQTGVVVLTTTDIAEGTNLYFTDEAAQDAVGTILTDSNTIDFTYTDGTPSIEADVITQMSITSDASGIKLVNDAATPGNTKYYGTDGAGTKGFFDFTAVGSAGDISETSFSAANNQIAPADVTGFAFAAGTVRSFKALLSVSIDATADLYEAFELVGINKNGSFDMAVSAVGDDSGIVFSITSAGQVQYTSTNVAGFVSDTMKFRAITTTV